jgi:hypothetical protein
MLAIRIVEHLDILDNIVTSLLAGFIMAIRRPLPLEAAEKPFRHCVVETLTFATHTAHDAVLA